MTHDYYKPCIECGNNLYDKSFYARKTDNERVCEPCFVDKGYYRDKATMLNFYKSTPVKDKKPNYTGGYLQISVVKWLIENHINDYNKKLDNLEYKKDLLNKDTFELKWNYTLGCKAALKSLMEELKELQI